MATSTINGNAWTQIATCDTVNENYGITFNYSRYSEILIIHDALDKSNQGVKQSFTCPVFWITTSNKTYCTWSGVGNGQIRKNGSNIQISGKNVTVFAR